MNYGSYRWYVMPTKSIVHAILDNVQHIHVAPHQCICKGLHHVHRKTSGKHLESQWIVRVLWVVWCEYDTPVTQQTFIVRRIITQRDTRTPVIQGGSQESNYLHFRHFRNVVVG